MSTNKMVAIIGIALSAVALCVGLPILAVVGLFGLWAVQTSAQPTPPIASAALPSTETVRPTTVSQPVMPLRSFVGTKPGPTLFILDAAWSDVFIGVWSLPHIKANSLALQLTEPDTGEMVYGYVIPRTELADKLTTILSDGKPHRLKLEIEHDTTGANASSRAVRIHRLAD